MGELSEKDFCQINNFQTKDLNEMMSYYEVREDGTLWIQQLDGHFEDGDPNGKSVMDRVGHFKVTEERWERSVFSGTVNFYSSVPCHKESKEERDKFNNDYFIEYRAIFKYGKVESVVIVSFEVTPNAQRKSNEAIWEKERRMQHAFDNTLFYRCLYRHYEWVLRGVFRGIHLVSQFIMNTLNKRLAVERKLDFAGRYINWKSGAKKIADDAKEKLKYD